MKKFAEMEERGEIPAGTYDTWAAETRDMASLPERIGPKRPQRAKKRNYPKPVKGGYR